VHLVGRAWRAHVPAGPGGPTAGGYVVDDGATFGVELNFDVL
jgi:hypothetical protein